MKEFKAILLHEFLVQNRSYNIIIYNIQFLLLSIFCLFFLYPIEGNISILSSIFLIAGFPISVIANSKPFIKKDLEDGTLELYLVTMSANFIIFTKFCALFLSNIISFIISILIIAFFYKTTAHQLSILMTASLLLIQTSALSILISSVEAYFRNNINLISSIIAPLILPSLIISGLMLNNNLNFYNGTMILISLSLIISPLCLFFSSYLVKNIYNI